MTTQSQKNLEFELKRSIQEGLNATVTDMCRRGHPDQATVIAKWSLEVMFEVYEAVRRNHRIGRPRRKQSELNP